MTRHILTASRTTTTVHESQRIVVDADSIERALDLAHAQLRLDQRREGAEPQTWTIEATAGNERASREVRA